MAGGGDSALRSAENGSRQRFQQFGLDFPFLKAGSHPETRGVGEGHLLITFSFQNQYSLSLPQWNPTHIY